MPLIGYRTLICKQNFDNMISRKIFHQNSKLICRTLYTNDFLSLSVVQEKQEILKRELKDKGLKHSELFENVKNSLTKNEVLSHDLTELILTSRSKNDLKSSTELFKDYVMSSGDQLTVSKRNASVMKDLVSVCHLHKSMDLIHPLMKVSWNPYFLTLKVPKNSCNFAINLRNFSG